MINCRFSLCDEAVHSVTHTHTDTDTHHTHTHNSDTPDQTHTHTHTLTQTHPTHTLCRPTHTHHTLTHTLWHTDTHTHSDTQAHTHTTTHHNTHSDTQTPRTPDTHTHTDTHTQTHTHTDTDTDTQHTDTDTDTHTHRHTHTHTTQTHTQTHTHTSCRCPSAADSFTAVQYELIHSHRLRNPGCVRWVTSDPRCLSGGGQRREGLSERQDYLARCLLRFWECCFFPGLSKLIHCFVAARCGCPVPSEEIEFIYLNQNFPSPSVTLHSRAQYRDLITALFRNTDAVVGEVQRGVARLRSLSLWLGFPRAGAPAPQTGPSIGRVSSKGPDRPAPQAHPSDPDDSLVQRAEHIPAGRRTPMCGHCNMVIRSDTCITSHDI